MLKMDNQKEFSLDSIPQYPSQKCYDCGTPLHPQNTSQWKEIQEHEGTEMAVALCIGCMRISSLMLASAKKNKKDELESTIDRKTAIKYIKSVDESREAWKPGLLADGSLHTDWQ